MAFPPQDWALGTPAPNPWADTPTPVPEGEDMLFGTPAPQPVLPDAPAAPGVPVFPPPEWGAPEVPLPPFMQRPLVPEQAPAAPLEGAPTAMPGQPPTLNPSQPSDEDAQPQAPVTAQERQARVFEDAEALAVERARLETARERENAEQRAEELRLNNEQAERNAAEYQATLADARGEMKSIRSDAKSLAEARIDPERFWKSRSVGQKFAAVIAAAMGGLTQAYQGGRNNALEMLMRSVDRDIEAQKADIATQQGALDTRRGLVQQLVANGESEYAAGEKVRIAALQTLDDRLAAELAKYDPQGTTALRIAEARNQVQAKRAEHETALEQTLFERKFAERKFAEQQRAQRAQEGLGWAGHALRRQEIALRKDEVSAAQNAKAAAERAELERTQGVSGFDAAPLRQRDGSTFVARTEKEGQAIREQMAGTKTMARLLDDMTLLRKKYGSSRALLNSEEYQRMKAQHAQLVTALKQKEQLGAMDKGMVEFAGKLFGDDPTAIYSNMSRWDEIREGIFNGVNDRLETQGYTGPRVGLAKPSLAKNLASATDAHAGQILQARLPTGPRPAAARLKAVDEYHSAVEKDLAQFRGASNTETVAQYQRAIDAYDQLIQQAVAYEPPTREELADQVRVQRALEAKRDRLVKEQDRYQAKVAAERTKPDVTLGDVMEAREFSPRM